MTGITCTVKSHQKYFFITTFRTLRSYLRHKLRLKHIADKDISYFNTGYWGIKSFRGKKLNDFNIHAHKSNQHLNLKLYLTNLQIIGFTGLIG